MLVNRMNHNLVKLGLQPLAEPDGAVLKTYLNAGPAVFGLVEDDPCIRSWVALSAVMSKHPMLFRISLTLFNTINLFYTSNIHIFYVAATQISLNIFHQI
jgi:hypothetical protein